jgi:tripartite-type tricarboxylate transporter receptor subunit TctC
VKDLVPVVSVGEAPLVMGSNPALEIRSVKDMIEYARAKPKLLTVASSGTGSSTHLALELFKHMAKVDITHVPYKGGGPAVAALLGGEVAMSFNTPATIAPHVKAGKARALAITGAKRYPGLPDIPTLIESGISGVEADPYWGLVGPAGLPPAIINRLHDVWTKHINAPEMRQRLIEMGFAPVANSPAEFSAHIRSDVAKWGKVIREAGVQPQ